MSDRFKGLISGAAREGMLQQCMRALENLGRSASWHASERNRLAGKTFDSLREHIDEAEALWEASQANRGGKP